jgi:outer membrane receptor for monomeric catechols
VQVTPDVLITNRFRDSHSTQNYIGTLPESPVIANPLSASTLSANPQSRYQATDVIANQTEATYKFNDGTGFKHTALAGFEYDHETSSIDKYLGLSSEALPGGFSGTGSLTGVSVFNPQFTNLPFGIPAGLSGLPTNIRIDTNSVYVIPPANTTLYASNVGLPLANIAHQSFSLLSKYQLNDTWELGGQAVYRSKIYGGTFLAANQGTSIPSYWRFDVFAEAKINKNWQVKLFVNNIFDKRYYDALYQSAAPFVLEAPGRAAYLVISARY